MSPRFEEAAQTVAEERMVIGNQNPHDASREVVGKIRDAARVIDMKAREQYSGVGRAS
jgi:hypothetical protein